MCKRNTSLKVLILRHPFTFHPIDLETAELPVAKPARQTYEWLVPRGILKRNWVGFLIIKMKPSLTCLCPPR